MDDVENCFTVELAIKKLQDEGYVEKHGSGRNTFYARVFSYRKEAPEYNIKIGEKDEL